MKIEDLRLCQIQEWYPIFKSNSIRTIFHPLPGDFIRYILGDSASSGGSPPPFFLPATSSGRDPFPRTSSSSLSNESDLDSDSDSDSDQLPPSFPALESAITQSIAFLGGAVFPKLNWSSPKDAAWISTDGSLRCTSFAEIAILLRSSDRAVHDLCHAISSCSDHLSSPYPFSFFIALRKFRHLIRPEMEFRCFVWQYKLIGISQREVTAFYHSLIDRRLELKQVIVDFFDEIVKSRFGLQDYTFDVYVGGDGKVRVLDFNPWGVFTLPLLFCWEELEMEGFGEDEEEGVEFRLVDGGCGVRPGLKTAVPLDYLDRGEGSGWDEFLRKMDDEMRMQMKDSTFGT